MYKIECFCLLIAFVWIFGNAEDVDPQLRKLLCGDDKTFREKAIACLEMMPKGQKSVIESCGLKILKRPIDFGDIVDQLCAEAPEAHEILECGKHGMHGEDSSEESDSESHEHNHHHHPDQPSAEEMSKYVICLSNLYASYNVTSQDPTAEK